MQHTRRVAWAFVWSFVGLLVIGVIFSSATYTHPNWSYGTSSAFSSCQNGDFRIKTVSFSCPIQKNVREFSVFPPKPRVCVTTLSRRPSCIPSPFSYRISSPRRPPKPAIGSSTIPNIWELFSATRDCGFLDSISSISARICQEQMSQNPVRRIEQQFNASAYGWEQRWAELQYADKWIRVKKGGLLDEIRDELAEYKKKKFQFRGGFPAFIGEKFGLKIREARVLMKEYFDFVAGGGKFVDGDIVLPDKWDGLTTEQIWADIQQTMMSTTTYEDYLAANPTVLAKKQAENNAVLLAYERAGGKREEEKAIDGELEAIGEKLGGLTSETEKADGIRMFVNKFKSGGLSDGLVALFGALNEAERVAIGKQLFSSLSEELLSDTTFSLVHFHHLQNLNQNTIDFSEFSPDKFQGVPSSLFSMVEGILNEATKENVVELFEFLAGEFASLGREPSTNLDALSQSVGSLSIGGGSNEPNKETPGAVDEVPFFAKDFQELRTSFRAGQQDLRTRGITEDDGQKWEVQAPNGRRRWVVVEEWTAHE